MTRQSVIRKLEQLSSREFARIAPFLEADLDLLEDVAALRREVAAGRRSAKAEPILTAREVYSRIRRKLSKR